MKDHSISESNIEGICRAFWRRIEPFKSKYNKELPPKLPIEFRCGMATALKIIEGREFVKDEYMKMQDFVISNKLYLNQIEDKSHADIIIEMAKKHMERNYG